MYLHENETAININQYLATQNKIPLTNKPMFKLVWSDDQRELRRGEFNEYCGPIFIRTYTGVKLVPKYPFIEHRWVLEQWYPPTLSYDQDLPESKSGSYEPIYVFEDSKFNPLPLRLDVVQLIMHHINKPVRSSQAMKDTYKNDKLDREDRQYELDFDTLNDESYLVSQMHSGSAGLVPHEYFVDSPNLRNKND